MKPFPIPVVALGPGSQPMEEDDALAFIAMPQGMDTFNPPRLPDATDPAARADSLRVLRQLQHEMGAIGFGGDVYPLIHLDMLDAGVRQQVNDALGEGEVSAVAGGAVPLRVQESAFAGIWRVLYQAPSGTTLADCIEVCAVPAALIDRARAAASEALPVPPMPPGVMNAPALLTELQDAVRRHREGAPAHVINLTLLPLVPEDVDVLQAALGTGAVVILSRGYGNCRITSTRLANTWWVRYYNSSDQLILNTIEVTDMPEAALASAEDVADSLARLAEWIEAIAAE